MNPSRSSLGPSAFRTTHWSVVLAAARECDPEAEGALEALCLAYWYPLYVFLLRKGLDHTQAEDLTQQFFATKIVTRSIFSGIDPGQGKFRTWLLNSLQNMLRNEWDRQNAQKRGGGRECLSLDFQDVDGQYLHEPADNRTPEESYDRAWAVTVMRRALERLRKARTSQGEGDTFECYLSYLPGALDPPPHAVTAARLGKTVSAVKMAVKRLRRDYGQAVRREIAETLSPGADVEKELRTLLAALDS